MDTDQTGLEEFQGGLYICSHTKSWYIRQFLFNSERPSQAYDV